MSLIRANRRIDWVEGNSGGCGRGCGDRGDFREVDVIDGDFKDFEKL